MDVEIVVVDTPAEVAESVASLLAGAARAGASIVLAGGETPRGAYVLAARAEPDWSRAEIWLGDERVVARDDLLSNARLVREALLDRVARPPAVHFVRTELGPEQAAAAYDRELGDAHLDLALLGVGADGHTASLFPESPALQERRRLAVKAEPELEPWVERVTLTIPALSAADHVVFMVVGKTKAEAARRAFAERPSPATPASLVRSRTGKTTAILDREAAAELG